MTDQNKPGEGEVPDPKPVLPAFTIKNPSNAAQSPLKQMVEIVENTKIAPEDKAILIEFSRQRFKNRTRIAYLALFTIIISIALLFIAAFIDGLSAEAAARKGILFVIAENKSLFTWIEGFLTSIVGYYYGVTALRPSS